MRITDVEALLLRQPDLDPTIADGSQDALIVRVHTDEGIVGVGEVDSLPSVVKAIIDAPPSHSIAAGLRSLVIGEDPFEVRRLWERMFRGSLYYGRRGAAIHAISGIEIALWDIVGKATGRPIHALIGGARRDRVRAYASTLMPDTPEEARRIVTRQVEEGFTAVKLGWGPLGSDAALDIALVAAARAAAGPDVELMIDIGKGWTSVRDGIERARRMEEHRPAWIEEPFMPDDYAKYAALAEAVDIPLAAGEEETTVWDFERLLDQGCVEIAQPDVTRVGGISEALRVAELVRRRGRRCVLHAWSTGIIKAATLHVLAAMDEAEYFEDCVRTTTLNERLVAERFPLVDGHVQVPNKPGLGGRGGRGAAARVSGGRGSLSGRVVTLGEAMLRLQAPDGELLKTARRLDAYVAGAEANVAAALASLGVPTAWISALPESPLGDRVAEELGAAGVDLSFVVRIPGTRLGLFFVERGSEPRPTRVWYDRADSAFARWDGLDEFDFAGATWAVVSGITPALGTAARLMTDRFVAAARSEGARICIDVNYRALLWDPPVAREVLASLLSHADVVICSERDARTVFEVEGDGLAAATSLAGRYAPGAELVVLTCASAGSVLVAGDAQIRQPAFPTRVVDRFGAGDAFTAGLLWGLLQGFEDGDALRAATALASLKCGVLGDFARFGRSDVEAVMASLDGAAILR